MLQWLFRHVCLCSRADPERDSLLSHPPNRLAFPPPNTILTAPSRHPRPSPLGDLPHLRSTSSFSTPGTGTGARDPSFATALPSGASGALGSPADVEEGRERIAIIGRFYSQRMRPLTRSSLPPSPAYNPLQSHSHTRNAHTSYPNTPFAAYPSVPPPYPQSHTVPTSPAQPLHPSPSLPIHPTPLHPSDPEARPGLISRSISAPQALSLHLASLRSSHPTLFSPSRAERAAEIEGFGTHQLPHGAQTDPRSVMIYRGRPRSATTLAAGARSSSTLSGGGLGVRDSGGMRSVSDEGVQRAIGASGVEGLEWTGRRGRSPGPPRIAASRRNTGSPVGGGIGRPGMGSRTASRLGSRDLSGSEERPVRSGGLAVPTSAGSGVGGSTRETSPNMSMDGDVRSRGETSATRGTAEGNSEGESKMEEEAEREDGVVKMDLGLADMFRPLGHRATRSAGAASGMRGGSRPGRGKRRVMTG